MTRPFLYGHYNKLNYIGANTIIYHCELPSDAKIESRCIKLRNVPWVLEDDGKRFVFAVDTNSVLEKSKKGGRLENGYLVIPIGSSKYYFSNETQDNIGPHIKLKIKKKSGSGAAFFASMAAIDFLAGTEYNIYINLIASHECEYIKDIIKNHDKAEYTPICRCSDREIGRTISFNVNNKDVIFRQNDTPETQPYCGKCRINTVPSSSDIVEAISIKDPVLFETILQYVTGNPQIGRRRPLFFMALSDLMIKKIGPQRLIQSFEYANAVICNQEDMKELLEIKDPPKLDEPENLYSIVQKVKPPEGEIYVTFGSEGAVVMGKSNNLYHQPSNELGVKLTLGCGDTFSGFLPALISIKGFTTLQLLDGANTAGQLHALGENVTLENLIMFRRENPAPIYKYNLKSKNFELESRGQSIWFNI